MLPASHSPFEAYRRDLARGGDRSAFGSRDATWVTLASVLWKVAQLPREEAAHVCASLQSPSAAEAITRPADDAGQAAADGSVAHVAQRLLDEPRDRALDAVLAVASEMEDAGALLLAYSVLAAFNSILGEEPSRARGRVAAQQARVARQFGALEVAEAHYSAAGRIGRELRDVDLVVRADLGSGVVARHRGNYPRARQLFRRALKRATSAGLDELVAIAHEGLLIAAAVARDFDGALQHGWAALRHANGNPLRETELLINLSAASSDAGFDEPALRGYLAAAARTNLTRLRLPALGGAAVSAARLGRRALVDRLSSDIERELDTEGFPYESAQALGNLAEARAILGEAGSAAQYADRAAELAARHSLHELAYQIDEARRRAVPVRERRQLSELAPASRTVLRSLERLDDGELERTGGPAVRCAD